MKYLVDLTGRFIYSPTSARSITLSKDILLVETIANQAKHFLNTNKDYVWRLWSRTAWYFRLDGVNLDTSSLSDEASCKLMETRNAPSIVIFRDPKKTIGQYQLAFNLKNDSKTPSIAFKLAYYDQEQQQWLFTKCQPNKSTRPCTLCQQPIIVGFRHKERGLDSINKMVICSQCQSQKFHNDNNHSFEPFYVSHCEAFPLHRIFILKYMDLLTT